MPMCPSSWAGNKILSKADRVFVGRSIALTSPGVQIPAHVAWELLAGGMQHEASLAGTAPVVPNHLQRTVFFLPLLWLQALSAFSPAFPRVFSALWLTVGATEVMVSGKGRGCALLTAVWNKRHPCPTDPADQLGSCRTSWRWTLPGNMLLHPKKEGIGSQIFLLICLALLPSHSFVGFLLLLFLCCRRRSAQLRAAWDGGSHVCQQHHVKQPLQNHIPPSCNFIRWIGDLKSNKFFSLFLSRCCFVPCAVNSRRASFQLNLKPGNVIFSQCSSLPLRLAVGLPHAQLLGCSVAMLPTAAHSPLFFAHRLLLLGSSSVCSLGSRLGMPSTFCALLTSIASLCFCSAVLTQLWVNQVSEIFPPFTNSISGFSVAGHLWYSPGQHFCMISLRISLAFSGTPQCAHPSASVMPNELEGAVRHAGSLKYLPKPLALHQSISTSRTLSLLPPSIRSSTSTLLQWCYLA